MIREHQTDKTVRFSLEDLDIEVEETEESDGEGVSTPLRSPPPATPTPSPTFSVSTLESSSGPLTPPPNQPMPRAFDTKGIPFPESLVARSPAIPKLAPVLISAFPLRWDMNENPAKMINKLPEDGGNDPAGTMPSGEQIRQMQVVHEAFADWPLCITSSDGLSVLTVHQVLLSIHGHLQKMVSAEYFESTSRSVQKDVCDRYKERMKSIPRGSSKVGLQRIDYLPGRVYVGLKVRAETDGNWEFVLDTQS